jgi:hypothetical protein
MNVTLLEESRKFLTSSCEVRRGRGAPKLRATTLTRRDEHSIRGLCRSVVNQSLGRLSPNGHPALDLGVCRSLNDLLVHKFVGGSVRPAINDLLGLSVTDSW